MKQTEAQRGHGVLDLAVNLNLNLNHHLFSHPFSLSERAQLVSESSYLH